MMKLKKRLRRKKTATPSSLVGYAAVRNGGDVEHRRKTNASERCFLSMLWAEIPAQEDTCTDATRVWRIAGNEIT